MAKEAKLRVVMVTGRLMLLGRSEQEPCCGSQHV